MEQIPQLPPESNSLFYEVMKNLFPFIAILLIVIAMLPHDIKLKLLRLYHWITSFFNKPVEKKNIDNDINREEVTIEVEDKKEELEKRIYDLIDILGSENNKNKPIKKKTSDINKKWKG